MSIFERDKSESRLPVSVITGFLGSGKTTLLNRLLRHPGMSDSAVIINEWGEVSLDHLLVERLEGEVAVLASGCVCCTLRSDLETTLRSLLIRRDRGEIPEFSRILLETTGLADPAPIMQTLLNNPLISHYLRLDTVVTTIDSVNAARQLSEHEEAVKQVAIADRLLLTKTDLAQEPELDGVRRELAQLNPGAKILPVAHGDIAPEALFGAALFDPARKTPDVRAWLNLSPDNSPKSEEEPVGTPHHDHDHATHHHTGIRSFCLTFQERLPWDLVSAWLQMLRQARGEDLLRVKGILYLQEESLPIAIHGVHHIFHPPVQLGALPADDGQSRIVFITRGLEQADVEDAWLAFRAEAAAS